MRLVVLQPGYLPWLGYFDQLRRADVFVHYDDVQYDKHGWRNRNRVRSTGAQGWSWLTVPVRTTGRFGAPIHEIELDEPTRWGEKHWRTLVQLYRKTPHFARYAPELEAIYRAEWRLLVDVDLALIEVLARLFGLEPRRTERSSRLPVRPGDDPTQRLLDLCLHFGADEYLSGAAARQYLDVGRFEERGIRVIYQDYVHPTYRQAFPGFVSHLAAVDLLFNVGPGSLALMSGEGAPLAP